jgi:hypothetical protein
MAISGTAVLVWIRHGCLTLVVTARLRVEVLGIGCDLCCAVQIMSSSEPTVQHGRTLPSCLFTAGANGFVPAPEGISMSGQDDMGSPAVRTGAERGAQQRLSRRSVLRGAAGAGVAGIAATALAGTAVPAVAASARSAVPAARGMKAETKDADADADQIVVHVRDAESGEIDVFRGTSQTRLRDPELAARLVRASR